jgi:hypothetical protein
VGISHELPCYLCGRGFRAQFSAAQASGKRNASEYAAPPPPPPVVKPFGGGFNFNKAGKDEILLDVKLSADCQSVVMCSASASGGSPIYINVSPLAPGHCILVPFPQRCLPQVITTEALELALALAASSSRPDFRLIFNSMGAWASVNHLHVHGVYMQGVAGKEGRFAVEDMARESINGCGGRSAPAVSVSRLAGFPHWALILSVGDSTSAESAGGGGESESESESGGGATGWVQVLSRAVGSLCGFLQCRDLAHNLMVTDGGRTVFVFPRKKNDSFHGGGMNCAVYEMCGQVFCKDRETFECMTTELFLAHLAAQVHLEPAAFDAACNWVRAWIECGLFKVKGSGSGGGSGSIDGSGSGCGSAPRSGSASSGGGDGDGGSHHQLVGALLDRVAEQEALRRRLRARASSMA